MGIEVQMPTLEENRGARLLLVLSKVSQSLQSARSPGDVYKKFGESIHELGFEATILSLDDSGKFLTTTYQQREPKKIKRFSKRLGLSINDYRVPIRKNGILDKVVNAGRTVFLESRKEIFLEIFPKGVRSLIKPMVTKYGKDMHSIIAPLRFDEKTFGVMGVSGADLGEIEIPAITVFAGQVSAAIMNAQTYSALQKREGEKFRIIFESAPDPYYLSDLKGEFIDGNKETERITGYSKEELIGKSFLKLNLLPKNQLTTAATLLAKNVLGRSTGPDEFTLIRKDGSEIEVEITTHPVNIEGKTVVLGIARDITERKRAEETLQESEERYRTLFESVNDAIISLSKSGKIIDINDSVMDIFGYTRDEVIGKSFAKLGILSPKEFPEMFKLFVKAVRGGGNEKIREWLIRHKNGTMIPTEVSASIVKKNGKVDGVVAIIRDITERKRAQEQRAIHLERMEILRQIDLAISGSLDLSTTLEVLLDQITQRLGIDAADVLLFDSDQQHLQRAAGRGFKTEALQHTKLEPGEGYAGQVVANRETLFVPDLRQEPGALIQSPLFESEGFISYISAPLIAKDEVKGVIELFQRTEFKPDEEWFEFVEMLATQAAIAIDNASMYQDLEQHSAFLEQAVEEATDELRHSKEQLETILNNSPNTVLLLTPEGIIRLCNSSITKTFGYLSDEIRSEHVRDLVDDSMADSMTLALEDVLTADNARRIEILAIRKDKTTFDAVINLAAIRHDDEVNAIVCTIMDISPLKAAERAKDAFVSNVSHELRTPITSLRLNHSLLKRDPEEPKYLDRFDRDITRLNQLIEDLLRLSRLDQGQVELKIEPVDLNDLLAETAQDRVVMAESNELELVVVRQEAHIPLVQADINLLGQVLSVLLTNAIHYTPAGGHIEVRAVHEERDGASWAGFHVRDDGLGISSNDLPHLFERFYRGTVGRKSGAPGTGLGLSIASEIVKRHHGHIDVESTGIPAEGTTFTVWLPAVHDSDRSEK